MQTKTILRIGAVAFVAVALAISALQIRMSPGPIAADRVAAPIAGADPLRPELLRCQAIGAAGATDQKCLRTWAENRRRFLAPNSDPAAALPGAGVARGMLGDEADLGASTPIARGVAPPEGR